MSNLANLRLTKIWVLQNRMLWSFLFADEKVQLNCHSHHTLNICFLWWNKYHSINFSLIKRLKRIQFFIVWVSGPKYYTHFCMCLNSQHDCTSRFLYYGYVSFHFVPKYFLFNISNLLFCKGISIKYKNNTIGVFFYVVQNTFCLTSKILYYVKHIGHTFRALGLGFFSQVKGK